MPASSTSAAAPNAEFEAAGAQVVVPEAQRVGVELGGEVGAARQPVEIVAQEHEAVAVELRRRIRLATEGERDPVVQLIGGRGRGRNSDGERDREPAHARSSH